MRYEAERKLLLEMIHDLWDRRLTNAAGGNLSLRIDSGHMLLSPSRMSEDRHCRISTDELLLTDLDGNVLEGTGVVSREGRMHALLYQNIPEIGGVIHAHPFYTMVYVAAGKPVPQSTEATLRMGDAGVVEQAKAYSPALAAHTLAYFLPRRETLQKTGLCALLPGHGTVAVGKSIQQAFSVVERVEADAVCSLLGRLLP